MLHVADTRRALSVHLAIADMPGANRLTLHVLAAAEHELGEAVVKCRDDFDADDVVVEINFGGDMPTEAGR